MSEDLQVQRPKVGDRIIWHADNAGGKAIVVEVLHDETTDNEGRRATSQPRVRAMDTEADWKKPQTLMPYEYELAGEDQETRFAEETRQHIMAVDNRLIRFAQRLQRRGLDHDASKLMEPELSVFAEQTAKLKDLEYGSEAYHQALKDLGPALTHHYEHNDHHPEHHADGINGMDLLQLVEMYCDWCAASQRMKDGSIEQSIEINTERFGLSEQLAQIFRNTAARGLR